MQYEIEILPDGGKRAVLSQKIDMDSFVELENLTQELAGAVAVKLNLRQVVGMNSVGTRLWIPFIRALSAAKEVYFEDCQPNFVSQIHLVPSVLSNAKVASFYANFYCDSCDKSFTERFAVESAADAEKLQIPPCPNACGSQPEPEDPHCFNFLEKQKRVG